MGIVACTFILFFPQNFTKQLETAHHQLKKVITRIETKYQFLLTSVMTFRLTCHVTEFGGPSSEIWHDSELPSQVFPYQKKKQYNSFQHDNLLWRKKNYILIHHCNQKKFLPWKVYVIWDIPSKVFGILKGWKVSITH